MRLSFHHSFFIASLAFMLVFATSGAPISLFNTYRLENGLSNSDLGFVSLGYFIAAAIALLMFGRLSNFIGRKPMAILALLCVIASSLLLTQMHSTPVLFVARVLQGLACGIATSSIGAYVVDLSEGKPGWLVAAVTSTSPMIGISSGAITSGALVSWGPWPRVLIFIMLFSVLLVCLLLVILSPETIKRKPRGFSALKPSLYLPRERLWAFLIMACCVIATWSLGAFYQAFGPSIVAEQLGTRSAIVSALAFSSVMILTPLGGYITSNMSSAIAVRLGMGLYIVAATLILLALEQGWLLLFFTASLLVGVAQGIATTACLKVLLQDTDIEYRAGLLSTVFVVSYSGAVFPGMVASVAATSFSVFEICVGYVVLGIITASIAIGASSKIRLTPNASVNY
ncbi:MFS transporter [Shewanella sp. Isolate11]|uniref:MFS transporter n=1 Tax=Shewanella sp. Isolate11 TaxID=2908530 RepID=UPI001EFCFA35|nr:MFS transporter [Shewanella sp. Isolate11]MCG9698349.1 MFS transporter [Shewanella sp. Isolate11]